MINAKTALLIPDICFILSMLCPAYAMARLVKPFVQNPKSVGYAGAAYFSIILLLGTIPPIIGTFAARCLGVAAAMAVLCATDRRNYRQKAFLTLLFLSVMELISALAEILYDGIYSAAINFFFYLQKDNEILWTALYILMCGFLLVVYAFLLLICTWLVARACLKNHSRHLHAPLCAIFAPDSVAVARYDSFIWHKSPTNCDAHLTESIFQTRSRAYVCKKDGLTKKELFMLLAFPLIGIAGCLVLNHYRTYYIIEEGARSTKMDVVSIIFCVALLAGMLVSLTLYQGIKAEQEDRMQERLLAGQVEDMRRHIARVEELYEGIRGLKHDMANHIATLEKLYAGIGTKEAGDYAARLRTTLADVAGTIRSGNPVTDVILSEQRDEAEKKGIRFACDFHYPTCSGIEAFDMSIILNNALRNAIEYADAEDKKETYISLRSYRKNNACMIEVRNSFSGTVRVEADTGLINTSKEQGIHGYGLANIRRTAEKYHGDIDITLEKGEFCLTIMLMME